MSRRKNKENRRASSARLPEESGDDTLIDLVEVTGSARTFLDKYQNQLIGGLAGILILVGAFFAYKNLYQEPREIEATEALGQAQIQFERDSFAAALNNPGTQGAGFLEIIDTYGGTKAGNLAKYYAGVSYLNLGSFDDAITYLNKFKSVGQVTPILKYGALGDAYSELGDAGKAMDMYKKAGNVNSNEFLAPYYLNKYALLARKEGKSDMAMATLKMIKTKYPLSTEAIEADKYIGMME